MGGDWHADVGERSNGSIKAADTNREFDVAQAEGFTERIGGGSLSVFTRSVQVEKSNVRHVNDSMLERCRLEYCQGGWGNTLGRRVDAAPTG